MTTKYHTLQPWLAEILSAIKKDIKSDYLPADNAFYRTNFGHRPLNRLSPEEIHLAFIKELLAGNKEMDEWVVNRWVFKHGELYSHFAERLTKISEDFGALKQLSLEESSMILKGAVERFGAKPVYFFSVLNNVVFPNEVLMQLRKLASEAHDLMHAQERSASEQLELGKVKEHYEREMARLKEKYEARLEGVLKRYTIDTEALKKQVRALQRQVNEQSK